MICRDDDFHRKSVKPVGGLAGVVTHGINYPTKDPGKASSWWNTKWCWAWALLGWGNYKWSLKKSFCIYLRPTLGSKVHQGKAERGRWGYSPGCSDQSLYFFLDLYDLIIHQICVFNTNTKPDALSGSSWTGAASRCTSLGRARQEPSSDLQLWLPKIQFVLDLFCLKTNGG